jgi:hypothetical protein
MQNAGLHARQRIMFFEWIGPLDAQGNETRFAGKRAASQLSDAAGITSLILLAEKIQKQ